MRRPSRSRAGSVGLLALAVVAAFGTVIAVGLSLRANDLAFEPHSLCRAAARSAAESGIARLRGGASAARGALPGGPAGATVGYEASSRGAVLSSAGRCALPGRRATEVRIEAAIEGGRVTRWRESP